MVARPKPARLPVLDLDAVASETATVMVEYAGQSFNVIYSPYVLTPIVAREIDQLIEDRTAWLCRWLDVMIVDWEVVRAGVKVPPTAEVMEALPYSLLGAIRAAVETDLRPGE